MHPGDAEGFGRWPGDPGRRRGYNRATGRSSGGRRAWMPRWAPAPFRSPTLAGGACSERNPLAVKTFLFDRIGGGRADARVRVGFRYDIEAGGNLGVTVESGALD